MKTRLILIAALALLCSGCQAQRGSYRPHVVAEYPHDETSYTQGLFFHNGNLYESTGQYGESTFRVVDLNTGEALERLDFGEEYFVEGSVILGDNLYILTWTNKVLFVYDAKTLEYKQTYKYPRQGWGLTTDGKNLIASDGSSRLYFMDESFKSVKTINVKKDGRPIRYLNELEYIDGRIWANVYMTDIILIINPSDGKVEATIDCTGLLPRKLRDDNTDVLNGIARNPENGKIYLTGKNWKRMYEVTLEKK